MTRRLTLEFGLEATSGNGLTDRSLDAIEGSRAAFESGFDTVFQNSARDVARNISSSSALITSNPAVILAPIVTANAAIQRGGMDLLTSGDVRIELGSSRSFQPYVLGGAGVSKALGASPSAGITGDYAFQLVLPSGTAPIHETDSVGIEWRRPFRLLVITGAGFVRPVTRRTGLRFEVRGSFAMDGDTVLLTAQPSFVPGAPAAGLFLDPGLGSGVSRTPILANAVLPAGVTPRTLAGPALSAEMPIFSARGWLAQVDVNVGYFIRF
jgi:hypothetical protein